MRGNFHVVVNNTWYSNLFDHKLNKLFSIENFSGAKHAGKVLIIIIILFLIIIPKEHVCGKAGWQQHHWDWKELWN